MPPRTAERAEVSLAEVESALDKLEARGARSFDVMGCDCVRALITRAEQVAGRAGELIGERAGVHLERLRARFDAQRANTEAALAELERAHGPQAKLREKMSDGELQKVRRKLRRLASEPVVAAKPKLTRPRKRDVDHVDYEDSLAELVAAFALARALDVVPEHAGPYNPLRIASDLLTRMRTVSPLYLTAQLNRLEELASMMELPELPEPPSKTLPKKKRGALRSGSS